MTSDRPALPPSPIPTPIDPQAVAAAVAAPRGFWQRPFVQNALPVLMSLSVHSAVVILGVVALKTIDMVTSPPPVVETMATAAETGMQPDLMGDAIDPERHRGPGVDELLETRKDLDRTATDRGWNTQRGVDLNSFKAGAEGQGQNATVIGFGPNPGYGAGKSGLGTGDGGDGGPQAPFGTPQIGGTRDTIFKPGGAGPSHRVRSVAYVCDASGSMINTFPALKAEIIKSVNGLKPFQAFNIIFFANEDATAATKGGLLAAVPMNKRKAADFVDDFYPSGTTDALPALELAFRQKPELIWLLTDADFPDNAAVLNFIRKHNADKRVQINTIAFVGGDEEVGESFINLMKQIAQENRGKFENVEERNLGQ